MRAEFTAGLSFAACVLFAAAAAADTLLTTTHYEAQYVSSLGIIDGQLPPDISFAFHFEGGDPLWEERFAVADIGTMNLLDDFVGYTLPPAIAAGIHIGPEPGPSAFPLGQSFSEQGITNTVHTSFGGYTITRVEQFVDDVIIEWTPAGHHDFALFGGAQTVRIYGSIPEPTTLTILLVVVCHMIAWRCHS